MRGTARRTKPNLRGIRKEKTPEGTSNRETTLLRRGREAKGEREKADAVTHENQETAEGAKRAAVARRPSIADQGEGSMKDKTRNIRSRAPTTTEKKEREIGRGQTDGGGWERTDPGEIKEGDPHPKGNRTASSRGSRT